MFFPNAATVITHQTDNPRDIYDSISLTSRATHLLTVVTPTRCKSELLLFYYLLLISRTLQGYNADVQLHVYNFH